METLPKTRKAPMKPARMFTLMMTVVLAMEIVSPCPGQEQPEPTKPALPTEFAFALSPGGYGEFDHSPTNAADYENLLVNMKKAGFNTLYGVYKDWRLPLLEKQDVMLMVDVLAWKEGAMTDIRRDAKQRARVKEICESVRGNDAIWGYNIWNEKMSWFGNPDGHNIDEYITMLKTWDPTHPVWMGTYQVIYANAPKSKPGVHAYYDYHWQRGFHWHFAALNWYLGHARTQDGVIGRWMLGSDYNRNSYTLNTSIAFGLKVVIWFIGGPFDAKGNIDPNHRFAHLVTIGQEMDALYPELCKFLLPEVVYSTPTVKTADNKDKEKDVPWRLTPFPEDFWMQVAEGEAVLGFFKYENGDDAIYVANHNAFAPQKMVLELKGPTVKGKQVEILNRETSEWDVLGTDMCVFDLRAAGGELLRVKSK